MKNSSRNHLLWFVIMTEKTGKRDGKNRKDWKERKDRKDR